MLTVVAYSSPLLAKTGLNPPIRYLKTFFSPTRPINYHSTCVELNTNLLHNTSIC